MARNPAKMGLTRQSTRTQSHQHFLNHSNLYVAVVANAEVIKAKKIIIPDL